MSDIFPIFDFNRYEFKDRDSFDMSVCLRFRVWDICRINDLVRECFLCNFVSGKKFNASG